MKEDPEDPKVCRHPRGSSIHPHSLRSACIQAPHQWHGHFQESVWGKNNHELEVRFHFFLETIAQQVENTMYTTTSSAKPPIQRRRR